MAALSVEIFFSILLVVFAEDEELFSRTLSYPGWPHCELGGTYSVPHRKYCDRFFFCQHGQAYLGQCDDGLAFSPLDGCKLLHLVDCSTRPKLQKPQGKGNCFRQNGLFQDPRGCGRYFRCENGTETAERCTYGLEFDDIRKICRTATSEELEKCPQQTQSPVELTTDSPSTFKCPENDILPFGDHSRHPYPGNCVMFIMCLRDGGIKVGSCSKGSAYSPMTQNCESIAKVPNCPVFP